MKWFGYVRRILLGCLILNGGFGDPGGPYKKEERARPLEKTRYIPSHQKNAEQEARSTGAEPYWAYRSSRAPNRRTRNLSVTGYSKGAKKNKTSLKNLPIPPAPYGEPFKSEKLRESEGETHSHAKIKDFPVITAKQAILIDYESREVLLEKNAEEPTTPSSMTKIATACFIASKIKSAELSLDMQFLVSSQAFRKEGTTMFLKLGQKISVGDLLEGLIVVSANDAAVVLSEGTCGTEQAFGKELTSFVRSLGAWSTNFCNAHGLPDPMHKTTVKDLSLIACHAISDYPSIYHFYSQKEFSFNAVTQKNKNILLDRDIGCDGIKTGHTKDGGYGIVASCVQNGRRLIFVANGYESEQERANNACALITWGFRCFTNHHLYKTNEIIANLPVWYGKEGFVPVIVENDVTITLPRASQYDVTILLCYDTPLSAPIPKGKAVGEIQITSSMWDKPMLFPLVAASSINEASFFKKVSDSYHYLFLGTKAPRFSQKNE